MWNSLSRNTIEIFENRLIRSLHRLQQFGIVPDGVVCLLPYVQPMLTLIDNANAMNDAFRSISNDQIATEIGKKTIIVWMCCCRHSVAMARNRSRMEFCE